MSETTTERGSLSVETAEELKARGFDPDVVARHAARDAGLDAEPSSPEWLEAVLDRAEAGLVPAQRWGA